MVTRCRGSVAALLSRLGRLLVVVGLVALCVVDGDFAAYATGSTTMTNNTVAIAGFSWSSANPPTLNCSYGDPSWYTYGGNPSAPKACGAFTTGPGGTGGVGLNGDGAGAGHTSAGWSLRMVYTCSDSSSVSSTMGVGASATYQFRSNASTDCPTGTTITKVQVVGSVSGTVYLEETSAPLTAKCATTDFTNFAVASVAQSGGTYQVQVRFSWTLAGFKPGTWSVFYPDPGNNNGTATQTLTAANLVDGTTVNYYGAWSSSTSPSSLRVYAVPPSGFAGCDVETTTILASGLNPAVGGGPAGDGSTGCGFSLNVLHDFECAFTWAFDDPSISDQWSSFSSTVSSHPPVSVVVGGVSFVRSTVGNATGNVTPSLAVTLTGGSPGDQNCHVNSCPTGQGGNIDLGAEFTSLASTTPLVGYLRAVVEAGIWVSLLFICWRRTTAAFGAKPDGGDD